MTDVEIDLPAGWTELSDEKQDGSALVAYQYGTGEETTFIVSILPRVGERGYMLRLSTVDRTSTHVRHDYPVEEYDSLEVAVDGAESFLEHISQRLREDSMPAADPDIEAMRETIQAFTENRRFPAVRRLLRRFR